MTAVSRRASSISAVARLLLGFFVLGWNFRSCFGFGSYGFDMHHRFSDPVKAILGGDELPEKGSAEYYAAMAHRDRLIRGRHLSTAGDETTPVTFVYGNITIQIGAFGHLHYANVSVGTPTTSYLVALDTGSDLLWLPCDCSDNCVHAVKYSNGDVVQFDIYSPNTSTTSKKVSCNSTYCQQPQRCASPSSDCRYAVEYLSNDTSSSGILVEDVLHLTTDDAEEKDVDGRIAFGCGNKQTGIFLEGAAPNGLLGLGMDDSSVPSILARQGLASNSFSMCFGLDGIGRISFGENGTLDQAETPFNVNKHLYPTYNITVTQIAVGESVTDFEFYAIFDSGTSFTYLNDPAYSQITEKFNSPVKSNRVSIKDADLPFEYCYNTRPNQTLNLTMKGGKKYPLFEPIVEISETEGKNIFYCLGVVKSGDLNIIGQNFMSGYRVIFDRERMVLGWKESDCYKIEQTNTLLVTPSKSPAASPTVDSEATDGTNNTSRFTPKNDSPKLNSFTYALTMILCAFFAIV